MLKRQKEVIQSQLADEERVIKELETQYKRAIHDISDKIRILLSDEMTQSRIYHVQYQKALRKQVEAILEKLHSDEYTSIQQYLKNCYTDTFLGTMYDLAGQGMPIIVPIDQKAAVKAILTDSKLSEALYESLGIDTAEMKKAIRTEITRGIASSMEYADIVRNITNATGAPLSRAKVIVRTEGHRIQQASAEDSRQAAKSKGADVVKQWDATLDGATRKTHRKLDGQIREVDEPFEANGKKAMYPGDFGDPAEDCNCRCVALTRARAALDEDELKTMKERAAFFGIDKTDNFNDFKKKYLGAEKEIKQAEEQNGAVTNKFGQVILFDKRLETEKWAKSVNIIKQLAGEYDTRLTTVSPGAVAAAGTVDMGGAMRLSTASPHTAVHEFAHSIALTSLNKFKVEDHELFWKEIKSIKRAYIKDVGNDSARWISGYEHGSRSIDEFFAEAFTLAKGKQMGIQLPDAYGSDFTYANMVLEAVNKHFGKTKKH